MTGFNDLLGLRLVGSRDKVYVVELDAGPQHLHALGSVHGGVLLAMLDTAMARAVRHGDTTGSYMPTAELKTSFLRPAFAGHLAARAWVIRHGRRLAFAEAELLNAQGQCLAKASATFLRTADQAGA